MTFEFSADELQALIVEVFENGPETVQASIELALRLSAVAALGSEATLGDFYRYSIAELASSIDELLLVGGMARMPALKKYVTSIFSDIFQARVPAQFPESDAGVQEVVSLGLGLPANYSNLNMMRPDFEQRAASI
jgi:molecular chaperone DnaK (HSP70)